MAERKMDPASRTTQKHVVKSICLREPQKMVRKSFAMGYNSLKSRICINKNFLGAYGTHMLDLWVLEDWELIFQYQKHVVKSICLREPQKMVRKSSAIGNNSLKSLICIDKNSHLWAPMVPTCSTFGYGEVGNCFVIKNMHVAERKMDPAFPGLRGNM